MMVTTKTTVQNPIKVSFFGGLQFEDGASSITRKLNHSKKLSSLLAYLMIHKEKSISYVELLDTIWPDCERDDPLNALKTLLYRARNLMKDNGIPFYKECIIARRGTYRWNPEIRCQTDIDEFEKACKMAAAPGCPEEQRLELLWNAVKVYKGEFLPNCAAEDWVMPLSTYYHSAYIQAVHQLIDLLRKQHADEEIADLCRQALTYEQADEELHYHLILSLSNLSQNRAALSYYEYATKLFYNKLGITPSDRIRELYQRITETEKHIESDLDIIKTDLQESGDICGAFICEYSIFRQIYQLESRLAIRSGIHFYVALITLTGTGDKQLQVQQVVEAMEKLLEVLQSTLRKNDVVARFSSSQYVIMLPTSSEQYATIAVKRLVAFFKKQYTLDSVFVHYTVEPIDAAQ